MGFYSATIHRPGSGSHPAILKVRARLREHLEALQERFPIQLGGLVVIETITSDYRFRILVPKPQWVEVAAGLAGDISYTNFKSAAELAQGVEGRRFVDALHVVWTIMHQLQAPPFEPRRGR